MKKLKKYFSIFNVSVQNNFTYFGNFLTGTLFFIFILFVMTQLWRAIYTGKTLISGFSLNQVIWYLIITESIVLSRSNFHLEINDMVKSGDLAYLLIRPYSFICYHLFNSLGETLPKLTAHILVGLGVGLLLTGTVELNVFFPLVLIVIILGTILNFLFYIALGLTAFWTEDNTAFFFIYSKLVFFIGGMLVPIDFLPDWLKGFSGVSPFSFITYWPARLAVNFDLKLYWQVISGQIMYIFGIFVMVNWIYQKGVKQLNVNGG